MRNFEAYHPVPLLIYFVCVISIEMFVTNPVLIALSLFGSLCFYALLAKRRFWKDFLFYILAFVLISLANPLFSHNGRTVLFFVNGNPVTYEAFVYGFVIAAVIVSTLYWFKAFGKIMTSDKLLYLFGRAVPKLSIVLSSALRYIPLFRKQAEKIKNSQKAIGLYTKGNAVDNAKGIARVFSIMITWSLENAIDTADSMKARGYGLHGRTQFSIFRLNADDILLTSVSILLTVFTVSGVAAGTADFVFYPKLSAVLGTPWSIITYVAYGLLAFTPCLCEIKENLGWIYCKSKI